MTDPVAICAFTAVFFSGIGFGIAIAYVLLEQ